MSVLGLMVLFTAAGVYAAGFARPVVVKSDLPRIWSAAGAQERLKALRVAELDAYRALAERVYGFKLGSGSTVHDFALNSETVKNSMDALLKGAAQTEKVVYDENGMVTVVYGVNIKQIMEIVKKDRNVVNGSLKVKETSSIEESNKLLEACGNGALPGSPAMVMVQTKRAAEIDAYRKMAERFLGVKINSRSSVKDFCLTNDELKSSVDAYLKGLKPVAVEFKQDGVCSVTMQLKVREVIAVVDSLVRRYNQGGRKITSETIRNQNLDIVDKTFTVTGVGAPREVYQTPKAEPVEKTTEIRTEKTIVRKVVSRQPITE